MPNLGKRTTSKADQSVKKRRVLLEKPTGLDYFNYLNDDCLSKIFKYLSIKQRLDVATVCKRWRDASQLAWDDIKTLNFENSSLPWKQDYEELPPAYRTNNSISRILKSCGSSLRELQLGDHVNSNILRVLEHHCCDLTRLQVDISRKSRINPNLFLPMQKLNYLMIKGNKHSYSADFFEALPSENLTEIHLYVHSDNPYESVAGGLPSCTPKIYEKLTKLTAITFTGFVLKGKMLEVITRKNQLTHLSLSYCTPETNLSPLTRLSNLEHLDLSLGSSVDNNLLTEISKKCKKLRSLNILRCTKVTDRGILSLADLPQLEELDITWNAQIRGDHLSRLQHLKKLHAKDSRVTETHVISLIESAPYLEHLNLAYTGLPTDALKRAAAVANNRTNNVKLRIFVDMFSKDDWEHRNYGALFPLVVVDVQDIEKDFYNKMCRAEENDSSDSSDHD